MRIKVANTVITLQEKDFVDAGGMAKIYELSGIAYKVVNDVSKFNIALVNDLMELRGNPSLIIPQNVIYNEADIACGYTAPFLRASLPMAVFFAMEAWNDHNLKVSEADYIVEQLYNSIMRYIHLKGFVHGDPNPMNFLIFKKTAVDHDVAAIDLDGISKDSTKINAVSPVVFDYHTNKFCQKSDIFGIAVTSFWFYTGFHPYRPKHPGISENILTKGIVERMRKNLSAFSPGAIIPTGCRGMDGIPGGLVEYYEDTFLRNKRDYIPDAFSTKKPGKSAKKLSTTISPSAAVKLTLEDTITSNIEDAVFVDNKWYFRVVGEGSFIVIKGKKVYTNTIDQDLQLNPKISFVKDNRYYIISNSGLELSEVSYVLFGDSPVFAIKRTMSISKAAKCFSGCVAAVFFNSVAIIDAMAVKSVSNLKGRLLNLKVYQNIAFIVVESGNIFKRYVVNTDSNKILLEEEVTSTDINSVILKNGIVAELYHQEIILFKDDVNKSRKVSFKNYMKLITNGTNLYGILNNYFYKIEIA